VASDIALDFDKRIDDLSKEVAGLKGRGKDFWDKLQAASSLISGVALAFIGYYFTDSVKVALQERQLRLEHVKEMREVLLKMGSPALTPEEAEANALTLSAYGEESIVPLLIQLDSGENRAVGAEKGLRAVGLTAQEKTCASLHQVIRNRSGLFRWDTHLVCIRLAAELGCRAAQADLEQYQKMLDSALKSESELRAAAAAFQSNPELGREAATQLKSQIEAAKNTLGRLP